MQEGGHSIPVIEPNFLCENPMYVGAMATLHSGTAVAANIPVIILIPNLTQIFLIGFYEEREFALYVSSISNELKVPVRINCGVYIFTPDIFDTIKGVSTQWKDRGSDTFSMNRLPVLLIGPNVSISANARIGAGVRLISCIILDNVEIKENAVVIHAIVGWKSSIRRWSRATGDYNSKLGITILGEAVTVEDEVVVINSIVLPHKTLNVSVQEEIIL
ncbi:hypothetical protein C1H46_028146 [Malus baccata]|uniref:Mannose-1-phosphate guanyltransferase C-terminal domain-containing protein n=1 Tax=Malus baccata TaxID=106549 RepID=A0A540LIL5_MALBA|nr:hypothetical protein C1H46_028146 [Malus baccata]